MKFFLALSALVAVALADSGTVFEAKYFPSEPLPINTDPILRVVNGENAERNQFPYQISLRRRTLFLSSHICGGSIVSPNWVVSAAHCTHGTPASSFQVAAGILLLNEQNIPNQQVKDVREIINHPLYPGGNIVAPNDICLIHLAGNLQFGINVQPVGLPRPNSIARGDVNLSGWGAMRAGGSTPNHLQWVRVPIMPIDECKRVLDSFVGASQNPLSVTLNVCTGMRRGGESSCSGDSGGPIAENNVLEGVVSWGLANCGASGTPSVFVNVAAYLDWIEASTHGEVRP